MIRLSTLRQWTAQFCKLGPNKRSVLKPSQLKSSLQMGPELIEQPLLPQHQDYICPEGTDRMQ